MGKDSKNNHISYVPNIGHQLCYNTNTEKKITDFGG